MKNLSLFNFSGPCKNLMMIVPVFNFCKWSFVSPCYHNAVMKVSHYNTYVSTSIYCSLSCTTTLRSHGVRQVSRAAFESCDLEADYIKQWAVNVRQGSVNIPLEIGGHYYFIDSVAGGCLAGRKLSVSALKSVHATSLNYQGLCTYMARCNLSPLHIKWSGEGLHLAIIHKR